MDGVFSEASQQPLRRVRTGVAGLGVLLFAVALQLTALTWPSCYEGAAVCDAVGPDRSAAAAGIARTRP